eukprot:6179208-Pleurochrysis_carterae.AAC.6
MPPPPQQQPQHAHGRAAPPRGMLTSAMLGDGQATLKESGSVSSLVDMVRSRYARPDARVCECGRETHKRARLDRSKRCIHSPIHTPLKADVNGAG